MGQTEEEEGERDGEEEEVIGHFQPFVLSARSFNTLKKPNSYWTYTQIYMI